ncbi:RHS repeat domain-containing protein [Capnocytophaga canimorsus]|uniref:RHS repeat domain-containing protein n=1 Tax=Capnocytophaga canimorsus TaxID=28188 RepID=UPI001BB381F9|nr:RHS repeat-associated core domain-containing protein [Capnocytophaga canimorsus]
MCFRCVVKIKRYLWDGNVLLHEWEYNAADEPQLLVSPIGEVTFDKEEPIENLITWVYENGSFVPIGKLTENESFSIVSDYLGTPVQAFNAQGELVWARELDIYGRVRKEKGISNFVPFRYQGQYYDSEIDLCYNRFRYYDCNTGTYISQDPISILGGLNVYSYAKDSNKFVDIFGLAIWDTLGLDFKTWFDQATVSDIENNIKDVTSKRGLRFGGGKHEMFPVSQAPIAKSFGFKAGELEKMSIATENIIFVNVMDSNQNVINGKHHTSSASWHFHNQLIEKLKNIDPNIKNAKLEAKKIIAQHHKKHMRIICK